MARADGGAACDDGSGALEGVWDWDLPEPGDLAPSDSVPDPGPEPEPDGGDSDVGPAHGDESSSCSLQDEEESDDAERMAELAGVRVAEAIDGEDFAQVGSFFRHVVSGVLHRVRVLNPEFEGEATVFFCGRQANANYQETKECSLYEPRKCAKCWSER